MKPQLTLVALFLFLGTLTSQVRFKVKLLSDNQTYQVNFRPDTDWANPLSTTTSGQVTLRAHVGGFNAGPVTSIKGVWKLINTVTSPVEAPDYVYYVYALDQPIAGSQITYTTGVEIPMFSFKNTGSCTGPVEIISNVDDPFLEPNSQNLGIKNYLTVLGAGQGVDAYVGNYTTFDADCTPISNCGIEVFDVALVSPSGCGFADGSITIDAANSNGLPMQYTITYGNIPLIWQNSPVFTGLAAGNTFYVAVRDVIGLCLVEVGEFELEGPLAAIIQSVDINQPDCGGTNGSITINAISANGGTLEFAMDPMGPWQSSHTFGNLAEGTYTFYVQDIDNNCMNPVGTYTLSGCVEPDCILTYDMNDLGNGKYEVTMITDTTWNAPLNATSNLQVTIKVPTGGFQAANVVDETPGVDFDISEVIIAPMEDPQHDYITFALQSPTSSIPYVAGDTVHLFTFENTGSCTGDSIRFMLDDDPFMAPNSQNSSAGQYISVLGYGSADAPICLAKSAEICDATPPAPPSCLITYELEELPGDVIQVSVIADTTWNAPFNATSSAQVVVKVPTGGFVVGSLTSLEGTWEVGSIDVAPMEEPTSDYISFQLSNPTNLNVYQQGVKVPIFSFKNDGPCQGGLVYLMANNDPFLPPNSLNSNVSQYIAPLGSQGEPITICLSNLPADDCSNDPCAGLAPNFGPLEACEGAAFSFIDSTITNDVITSWSWDFGDNSAVATGQSPSHTYSSSGNFEVSLTVTTQGGCSATYMDFVTVFPSPGDAPVSSYDICNGAPVTLETPDNITSAVWSPTTNLDITDPFNPIASPTVTTVYTLTATNSFGCVNTSQVTVNVVQKPVLSNVSVSQITDCNKSDGSIQITATGVGNIEYGLDSGNGIVWQSGNTFANLVAGSYNVYVRNADGSCPAAYSNNPINIIAPIAPVITNVASTPPNGCANDGTITITATGGNPPLQYSIGGAAQSSNIFTGLGGGTYNIVVTNSNGTCATTASPVVFTQPTPPTIQPIADQSACVGSSVNIAAQFSAAISSFNITGSGVHSAETVNGNTLNFVATANATGVTTYNVTLTQANGCSATESFNLTGVAVPTAPFTVSPVICTNGQVVLHFTGSAVPSANLTWSLAGANIINQSPQNGNEPAKATMIVSWPTAGAKTVTLSVDNGGCIVTSSQTITVANFNPGATFAVTNASCNQPTGAINLSVNTTGFNFLWSNGKSTEDISGVAAGNYTVTISDPTSQCQSTASASVTGSPAVNFSTSTTQATNCTGANGDGSLTINVTSGTSPFTFSVSGQTPVSGPQTSVTFNNLSAGAYTVTVSDASGCTKNQTVTITSVTSQLNVGVTVVDAGCTTNNGNLTASVSGGQTPYTYSLYVNNQLVDADKPVNGSAVSLSGLAPGSYLLLFEDNVGCISAGAAVVGRMEGTFPATATITDASCGSNNGSITLTGVPASATLTWEPVVPVGVAAGVYTATITESNGCTSTESFVVSTSGGATVSLGTITPESCGLENGAVTFTVNGGGSYSYHFLGTNVMGFADGNIAEMATGLQEGTWVIEITDVLQSACRVYKVVIVPGGEAVETNSTVQFATGCGNHNGVICLDIVGGDAPYTVVSSDGTIQPGAAPNLFCVNGLYEGIVTITVTDANGCQKVFTQDMGDFAEPEITVDSIEITNPICPGDSGAIVSTTASEYMVFNSANGLFMGHTPLTALPAGTYRLELTVNGCTDSLTNVVVQGVADWNLVDSIEVQGCNTLGSISLDITGGTAPYTVDWNNAATGSSISNLTTGIYSATITDDNGCTTTSTYTVDFDCPDPCQGEPIFYDNIIFVNMESPMTEICLPTNETNLEDYELELDGEAYQRSIGDCGDATIFYTGFDVLPAGGYTLVEWIYGSNKEVNITFSDFAELVAIMNLKDPLGNWVLDGNSIFGGDPDKVYGHMLIRHNLSGNSVDLPSSKLTVPAPTITVENHSQTHVLIAISPNGCIDTLYINLALPEPATPDTISVTVAEGETQTVCIPVDELFGNIEFLTNIAISFTNNAQVLSTGDNCIEVVGVDEGPDQATIVICDDLGVCDTTIVLINVIDGGTELEIYTAFSPNGDGINDVFKIKNIEKYPNNEISIYNRWGKRVYTTKGYRNGWNGDYRNTRLTDGTYFYFLTVEVDGEMKEFTGFVELRR